MRVELISNAAELQDLRSDWNRVWRDDPASDPFASFEWFDTWWKHFGADRSTMLYHRRAEPDTISFDGLRRYVLVVRDAEETIAIAPFVRGRTRWRRLPVHGLSFAINSHSPRSGIAISRSRPAVLDALAEFLRRRRDWDLLLLDGLPDRDETGTSFHARLAGVGCSLTFGPPWSHCRLECEGSWAQFLSGKTYQFRRFLRRPVEALAELGAITYHQYDDHDSACTGMEEYIAIDAESWKAMHGESMALESNASAYYRELIRRFSEIGKVQIWILRIDGRAVAGYVCLSHNRILSFIKTSHVASIASARYAPGRVLLAHIVEHNWNSGFRGMDFVSRSQLVEHWANASVAFRPAAVFGAGAYASLLHTVDGVRRRFGTPARNVQAETS